MARTNATDVKIVISTDLSDAVVNSFITTANALVTDVLIGSGLSSTLLIEIEKWLTAHLLAMSRERQAQNKKVGKASENYGKFGLRLDATTYGQTVLTLDSSGRFASLGKPKAVFEAITSFS